MELSTKYSPSEIEAKWYRYWIENKLFHSEPDDREPYTIVIPPPNVTGVLHMGHMLNNTIQDVLVRRARMKGKNACWIPGTDHASIATEAKVVNKLAEEGIKKTDITRDEFLSHAWEWTHRHGGIILEQLKKLGCSCDWNRTAFTMDKIRSESVIKVFCDLYSKSMIYRGVRMINWDPKALTALSDEEVNYKEQQGKLFFLKYQIAGQNNFATVATTRPETIFGDTAMCINPNNPKTDHLKGKHVIVPIVGREIPVIEDEYVDIEFGTGCLKVTPAHDINDYMLGEKYSLPSIDIFNDNGTLNSNGAMYEGMDRFDCRKKIETDLTNAGLMEKTEPYTNKVGFSERTDVPVEPKLSTQWFLKMNSLASPALENVENNIIKFYPEKFKNTYRHWLVNIKDWCISRQLWWGHRIPAWYFTLPSGENKITVAENEEEARKKTLDQYPELKNTTLELRQDEDCLDTWFSSWLWPISVFDGINKPDNKEIKYYYPTNDLVTGPDIIFFWVARMIMAGYEYRGIEPFKNVYFTGIVRDKTGRKMSKQLGNSPDPVELINRYGADGVRMGMLLSAPAGNDIHFDEALCEQGRNFCNKIWNAFRLIKNWDTDNMKPEDIKPEENLIAENWFQNLIAGKAVEIDELFAKYRLSEALTLIYKLFWDDFCAWYLEIIKPEYGKPVNRQTYAKTLFFFEELLKLLHPFMPFITEELYHAISDKEESIMFVPSKIEEKTENSDNAVNQFENTKEIIAGIRNIRRQKNITPKEILPLYIKTKNNAGILAPIITKLGNISEIKYTDATPDGTVSYLVGTAEYSIPVEINKEEEINKAKKEIERLEAFLKTINAKLGNERFVASANPLVVETERKKQADAQSKISSLKEEINIFNK
ncbi:MAG: valine--tRNA ligase [Dysgonamonadaceae bacterium]|jgi:valyl-tRNA synthetase|nr:valine--tRNA ligase [Dysgonamonadaceae bacterium]